MEEYPLDAIELLSLTIIYSLCSRFGFYLFNLVRLLVCFYPAQEQMADYPFYSWSQDGLNQPSMPSGYAQVIPNLNLEPGHSCNIAEE